MMQVKGRKDQIKDLFGLVKGMYGVETALDFLGMLLNHEQKELRMQEEYASEIWNEIYAENEGELNGWK